MQCHLGISCVLCLNEININIHYIIMVASNINIKNISYIILVCCGSYGQCITIATNFEGKMAENLQICCKYIHISKCY